MTPTFFSTVEGLFEAYMLSDFPAVPFFFSNADAPADDQMTYVIFHVMTSEDVFPINIGLTSKSRNVGVVQADVYSPKNIGAGLARTIAYSIGNSLKRRDIASGVEGLIVFKDPAVVDRGEMRGKHKQEMRCPYRYDFEDYPQ